MDDNDIISAAVVDPAVIKAATVFDEQGQPHSPSPDELRRRAERVLTSVILGTLSDQSVATHISQRLYTLTLTTDTEYTMPAYIGRILYAYIDDTDGQPLEIFRSYSSFRDWRYRNYRRDTSNEDTPYILYYIERDDQHRLRIGLFPGVTSGDDIIIIFRRQPTSMVNLSFLPDVCHYYVELRVLDRMSGGHYKRDADNALIDMRRALAPAAGVVEQQFPKEIEWAIRVINSGKAVRAGSYTRYFGS